MFSRQYNEGFAAFKANVSRYANPYKAGTLNAIEWNKGFHDGSLAQLLGII